MRKALASALVAAIMIGPAFADGGTEAGVRLYRGSERAAAYQATTERGVAVWRPASSRAAPAPALALAGGPETKPCPCVIEKNVTVRIVRPRPNRLRTQGFYSGLQRKGWPNRQGFYSGQKTY